MCNRQGLPIRSGARCALPRPHIPSLRAFAPLRETLPDRLAGTARTCSAYPLRSFGLFTLIGAPLVSEAMTLGELVRSAAEINSASPAPANSEPQT